MSLCYAPQVTELMWELAVPGCCHPWGGGDGVRSDCFAREPWSYLLRTPRGIQRFGQSREILEGSIFVDLKSLLVPYGLPSFPPLSSSGPFPFPRYRALLALPSLPGCPAPLLFLPLAASAELRYSLPPPNKWGLSSLSRTSFIKREKAMVVS